MEQTENTESTRLLAATYDLPQGNISYDSIDASQVNTQESEPTPLPWRPLLILLLLFAVQPCAFDLIFPFVNQMIVEIGVTDDPDAVGYYSGLIESVFSVASFLAIMPCARLSDRYGRKPIILFGMCTLGVSVALFGLSKSYMSMIITRCIAGTLGGSWAATKVMIAEMTDETNQSTAFSLLVISMRIGQIVGLPLGGYLAHPERISTIFNTPFWRTFPFALPCFVVGVFAIVACIAGYFFLEETLNRKRINALAEAEEDVRILGVDPAGIDDPALLNRPAETTKQTTIRSVLTPSVLSILINSLTMTFAGEAMFALYALFAFTPVESGGLGLTEAGIGMHILFRSAIGLLVMLCYSPLERAIGLMPLYRLAMTFWPISVAFLPLLNGMAHASMQETWIFKLSLFLCWTFWSAGPLAYTGSSILITNAAPSPEALATLNGVSMMVAVLPQALAPVTVTTLFAFSKTSKVLDGHLYWIALLCIFTAGALHSYTLKVSKPTWRSKAKACT